MKIAHSQLEQLVTNTFIAAGCEEAEAGTIARRLVGANLVGHDSHGVIRMPIYVKWLQQGKVKANQPPEVIFDTGPIALLEGHLGFGQVLGERAMKMAIAKSAEFGVGVVALRNSAHVGRVGDWVEMAVEADKVAICCVNTSGLGMLTAPFGGIDRRLSANPFAAGIPVAGGLPIILDISCSAVAEGKLKVARNKGVPVPDNCIIDSAGNPTNDPEEFYCEPHGAILSFGGHKGYGLGVVVEILAGALTGGGCTTAGKDRLEQGMLAIVIDPYRFQSEDVFSADVRRFVDWVKSSRTTTPDGRILMPGEIEQVTRADRLANGIELDDMTWQQIAKACDEFGVSTSNLSAE